jgi:hypothetical protein
MKSLITYQMVGFDGFRQVKSTLTKKSPVEFVIDLMKEKIEEGMTVDLLCVVDVADKEANDYTALVSLVGGKVQEIVQRRNQERVEQEQRWRKEKEARAKDSELKTKALLKAKKAIAKRKKEEEK